MAAHDAQEAQIPQFYAGRSVFITGGTGFLGKVLIERLLSTCPEIGCLHLLMRQKKDVHPEKRLQQLKQSQVFDVLRQNNPTQLDKLAFVPGDTTQPRLGIASEHLAQLQNVSVVFHSAATLKFDEPLRSAVDHNIRSVIALLQICDELPNMEVFVHVSTAYSNAECGGGEVREQVYPAPVPLAELLALVDALPTSLLADITNKYIHPKPNTYTFTKAMAETVVADHHPQGYSLAIFRPTIVVSALRHPVPGWTEGLNGPSGVVAAAGKGLLHVFRAASAGRADMLPVDIAIDSLIAVAWDTAVHKWRAARVYNCSTGEHPTSWGQFKDDLREHARQHPLDGALWYPSGVIVSNITASRVLELLLHSVPHYSIEYCMRLLGIKSQFNLISMDQKLRAMNNALAFFGVREWDFHTDNLQRVRSALSAADARVYNLDVRTIDWKEHNVNFVRGTRRYLLRQRDEDLLTAERHMRRLGFLHYGMMSFFVFMFFKLLLQNEFLKKLMYRIVGTWLSPSGATHLSVQE